MRSDIVWSGRFQWCMKTSGGTVAAAASMNQLDGVVTGARSPNAVAPMIERAATVALTYVGRCIRIATTVSARAGSGCPIVNTTRSVRGVAG